MWRVTLRQAFGTEIKRVLVHAKDSTSARIAAVLQCGYEGWISIAAHRA